MRKTVIETSKYLFHDTLLCPNMWSNFVDIWLAKRSHWYNMIGLG